MTPTTRSRRPASVGSRWVPPTLALVLSSLLAALPSEPSAARQVTQTSTTAPQARVTVVRDQWRDAARQRAVPYKLYVPEGAGPFPIVLHSHGLGGSREGSAYILEAVSASGFVVVALQHPGSDSSIVPDFAASGREGRRRGARRAQLQQARQLQQAAEARYADVPFALDQLTAMQKADGPLKGRLDLSRVGMSGHSFGALSTLVAAGQATRPSGVTHRDTRITAAITYAPNKPRNMDAHEALRRVAIPILHMTGTDDVTRFDLEESPWERTVPYQVIEGDQYLIVLDGGDHMVFNDQRLPRTPDARTPDHRRVIVDESVRFWKAYLRGDRQARQEMCDLPARVKGVAEGYRKAPHCGTPTPIRPASGR